MKLRDDLKRLKKISLILLLVLAIVLLNDSGKCLVFKQIFLKLTSCFLFSYHVGHLCSEHCFLHATENTDSMTTCYMLHALNIECLSQVLLVSHHFLLYFVVSTWNHRGLRHY
ncbi:hypothetical protein RchiOBHm_Chr5g0034931 [Rosa chinensis]|uniref:Uncharacterized protein n=1 Tax=Rosa chinensis TaxID=74649 RepID=A0A2P6QB29_ROSCH|nr:hypothetical protein RchiOBHm_Chr5g0034931 [Rosa chinensis]